MATRRVQPEVAAKGGLLPWVSRWLFGVSLVLLVFGLFLAAVALAEPDEDDWGDSILHRVEQEIREREKLHYGLHLVLGRALSVCPCTRDLSRVQYLKARYHAHTLQQRALVTTDRPRTPEAMLRDAVRLTVGGVKWVGERALARIEHLKVRGSTRGGLAET